MNFGLYPFILICLNIVYNVTTKDEEFRHIKLKDFETEDSYLPVKPGTKFIIECEGNPSTDFHWYLDSPERLRNELLLEPLNLDKENSTHDFYKKQHSNQKNIAEGIYHFKFQAAEERRGMEKLTFVYKKKHTIEDSIKKSINISVIPVPKADL